MHRSKSAFFTGPGCHRPRRHLTALACGSALLLSACNEISRGTEAFHAGDFEGAEKILRKVARKAAGKNPTVSFSMDEKTTVEQVLPQVTRRAFLGWEAYAGSLIGMGRIEEGCTSIATALRPITVYVNGVKLEAPVSPREGDFWQAQVFSLRAWWVNLSCEDLEQFPW